MTTTGTVPPAKTFMGLAIPLARVKPGSLKCVGFHDAKNAFNGIQVKTVSRHFDEGMFFRTNTFCTATALCIEALSRTRKLSLGK